MTLASESGPIWLSLTSRVSTTTVSPLVDRDHRLVAHVPREVDAVFREVVSARHGAEAFQPTWGPSKARSASDSRSEAVLA